MVARDSIGRALAVLREVGTSDEPETLTEVSRATGLPKATVHRILCRLRAGGGVRRVRGRYYVGPAIRELGGGPSDEHVARLRRMAIPLLLELYEATGAIVGLGVVQGVRVRYVETIFGRSQLSVVQRTAVCAPMHCTAAGRILLAHDHTLLTRMVAEAPMAAFTPATVTSPVRLEVELIDVRRQGVARIRGEYVAGTVAVGAAVLGSAGRPVAALSLGWIDGDLDEEAARGRLRQAAVILRRSVGNSPPRLVG